MSLCLLREDQAELNVRSRAQVQRRRSGRQTKSGASGSEPLGAGKHVPDRVGEPAGDVDLRDLGAALLAEPALGALVALRVGRMAEHVHRRLEQGPAQVAGEALAVSCGVFGPPFGVACSRSEAQTTVRHSDMLADSKDEWPPARLDRRGPLATSRGLQGGESLSGRCCVIREDYA